MNTANKTNAVSTMIAAQLVNLASPQTHQMIAFGQQQGWGCRVLGQAPMPTETTRLGDWLIVPAHMDSSPLPERAFERVQAIYGSGLRPKGFVVVHEAPMLLAAPKESDARNFRLPLLPPKIKSALKVAGYGLGGLAALIAMVLGLLVMAFAVAMLAGIVLLPAALIAGATIVDPILIAVTDDDYWVEIDRWDV